MDQLPDIIKAAAQSPLGIVALGMLVVGGLARTFFNKDDHPIYRVFALAMILGAFLVAGWAIVNANQSPGPSTGGREDDTNRTPNSGPVIAGYVYYEIGLDGDVTKDGRLRLQRGGPAQYSDLRINDILQAVGVLEQNRVVDGANIREGATNTSRIKRTMLPLECVVIIAPPTQRINTRDPEVSSGGWVNIQTTDC